MENQVSWASERNPVGSWTPGPQDLEWAQIGLILNDLCSSNNIQLNWIHTSGEEVNVSEELIMDLNVHAEATLHHDESSKKLNSRTCRYEILQHFHSQQRNYWVNLRLQGKLACLQCADPAVSHSALHNPAVNAGILKFVIKARLQALPTQYNLSTWFPKRHDPFCLLHNDKQTTINSAHNERMPRI